MTSAVFTAKVRDILRDNAAYRLIGGQKSGVIDEGRLGLVLGGERRVFKRPLARRFAKYHIGVMLDASGSMSCNGTDKECVKMAKTLVPALIDAGAKVSLYAFNRSMSQLEVTLKGIEKGYKAQLMNKDHYAGNHDPYFMDIVGRALIADNESPGKILIVLSDGFPSCDYHPCGLAGCVKKLSMVALSKMTAENNILTPVLRFLRHAGVIVLGVGIGARYIQNVYGPQNGLLVEEIDQLFPLVSAFLERHVIRG